MIDANRHHIEAALEYSGGTHSFDDVKAAIIAGKMQLWYGPDGCAVTEIIQYPAKRVLHVFLASGTMEQILDMLDSALAWGMAQGCVSMTISGRKGWERVLAPHGFKPLLVTMERPITVVKTAEGVE